jgi:ATP-dependent helicase HrpA
MTVAAKDDPTRLHNLSEQLDSIMLAHRGEVRSRLAAARKRLASGQPVDRTLSDLERLVHDSASLVRRRREQRPTPTYDDALPVCQRRTDIADAIRHNQVVVVCGDTGSGKTTQLPKICIELGRGVHASIGHTQPRRIAARSVAQRITDELQVAPGEVVGFKVRFADQTKPHTLVRLMTDGILLAEIQHDPLLLAYDTLIIDEAHERSLNIDFILGYLKQLLPKRRDLKLIITSATIDPQRFSKHFDDAPIVMVEGRTYPVEVRYRPPVLDAGFDRSQALRDAIVAAVGECQYEAPGDTLIFLPGEREIREIADALSGGTLEVVPLFARLGVADQMKVFAKHSKTRVVLSTNVAETSLTVPGIRYVIDVGLARVSRYSPRSKVQRLPIEEVSRASADQRKGRCGRVGPGVCIRLYSEDDFNERPLYTDPEVLRTNLASVILQMKAFNLGRLEDFPFLDGPDYRQVRDGYQTLFELNALDEEHNLTPLGRIMARLPIDPKVARVIIEANELDCLREVLVIASALSVQDPRDRPIDRQAEADASHARFRVGSSDFLGFLNLWEFYAKQEAELSSSRLRKMCQTHFLSHQRMREWQDVHNQIVELSNELGWKINTEPAEPDRVHQALLAGLISYVGQRGEQGEYAGVRNKGFWLFPGSALFHRKPAWVMAAEIVETTKPYARTAAEVQPEWIERAASHLLKRTYVEPHWQRKTGRVMAYEKVMLYGLPLVAKRAASYEQVDPKTSREIFIHSGLVEDDIDLDAPFLRHNRNLVREIQLLEARTRRRDILVDPRTRYAFYDARIPANVTGLRSFNEWRRPAEHDNKRLLFMSPADLMLRHESELGVEQFPTKLRTPAGEFELSYHFEPGHAADGVTVTLPLAALNTVDAQQFDWLVPGLVEEKIIDLIRTLPKQIRVKVVPAPEYASRVVRMIEFGKGSLFQAAATALGKLTGDRIEASDFQPSELTDYLRMNIRVMDDEGRFVASGRDLAALREKLRDRLRQLLAEQIDPQWNRSGLTTWDVGDLPPRVEMRRGSATVQAFPGLLDEGSAAGLRLFDSLEAAQASTRHGVRRLFVIEYQKELDWHVRDLPDFDRMVMHYKPLGSRARLSNMLVEALAHRLITPDAALVRTRMEYELQLRSAWNRLRAESQWLGRIVVQSLAEHHEATLKLSSTKFPDLMQASIDDIRQQLARLVPADFVLSTPKDWVEHLPRYLKAINIRLKKLLDAGLRRDADCLVEVHEHWNKYLDWRKVQRDAIEPPMVTRYRWMIEEYRVSLFAQELKTSQPVSRKRLEEMWLAISPAKA